MMHYVRIVCPSSFCPAVVVIHNLKCKIITMCSCAVYMYFFIREFQYIATPQCLYAYSFETKMHFVSLQYILLFSLLLQFTHAKIIRQAKTVVSGQRGGLQQQERHQANTKKKKRRKKTHTDITARLCLCEIISMLGFHHLILLMFALALYLCFICVLLVIFLFIQFLFFQFFSTLFFFTFSNSIMQIISLVHFFFPFLLLVVAHFIFQNEKKKKNRILLENKNVYVNLYLDEQKTRNGLLVFYFNFIFTEY